MHDSYCPLCNAKLKQKPLEWRAFWHPFPLFRCPSCATTLVWNFREYALAMLLTWSVLLSPVLLVSITPSELWTVNQLLVLTYTQSAGVMMPFVSPIAMYVLLP